jgi:transcription-repair coupling factor (superfamily II helicase)
MKQRFLSAFSDALPFRVLASGLQSGHADSQIAVCGLSGSSLAVLLCLLASECKRQFLFVASNRNRAENVYDDIRFFDESLSTLLLLDASHEHSVTSHHGMVRALRELPSSRVQIIISSPPLLLRSLPSPSLAEEGTFRLSVGTELLLGEFVERLNQFGFERKDYVETSGEYSVRGGIMDVFPLGADNPIRVELMGDIIESLREFDPLSQRSIAHLSSAVVQRDVLNDGSHQNHGSSLFDYVQTDTVIVMEDEEQCAAAAKAVPGSVPLIRWEDMQQRIQSFQKVAIRPIAERSGKPLDFGIRPQPAFNSSIKILHEDLVNLQQNGFTIVLSADAQSELTRLKDLLSADQLSQEDRYDRNPLDQERLLFVVHSPHEGFVAPSLGFAWYTEHEIFARAKRRTRRRRAGFVGLSAKELRLLRRGDFVVHADYGIGKFDGLKKIRVKDIEQEVVRVLYDGKDILYVNTNHINKIQKFSSREGYTPKLSRLGSPDWDRLKARAKKRIKDIARDLINLYARRKASSGVAFPPDTLWQKELEASFMYEDTFDQAKATRDVKLDMEASNPMDRLICGDVGFGKTEVAVRAAFKSVMGGKQVGVLVPTTILALQHYNTFLDRLSRYSVNIQILSRLKSKNEQQETIEALKTGTVDIVIGTHRLLSRDVGFKNLGLLIVDEEHRFGVAAKERLRQLEANVDTLTLTATPIPRTLHFSLLGARDLSIIATPPRNRVPVVTEITQFSEELIREAVLREVQRGGQVYFVHDRVSNIGEITNRLGLMLPGVRIRYAHGQMNARELEQVMIDFLEKRCDVLVCTKIIESGLDIPNVNTIIINRADRFGMAELYQLRGRVGRSNVQAFAYLLVPPLSVLPRQTIQRLQAVEEFTELGSGFNLAMRDLEIRGAGNLLGAEQTGFIDSMGYETYTRILEESVAELKQQEFKNLFPEHQSITDYETVIEVDVAALIPEEYISTDTERLDVYRRLYGVRSNKQLDEIAEELKDRFGPIPSPVSNLLETVAIRMMASKANIRRIAIDANGLEVELPPETDASYYSSSRFNTIMSTIAEVKNGSLKLRTEGGSLKLSHSFLQGPSSTPLEDAKKFICRLFTISEEPSATMNP